MALDPLRVIAECLGEPADSMRSPATVEYRCPFMESKCSKTNHTNALPLPVCSIYPGKNPNKTPICVCPKRFYEAPIVQDVINACWIGEKPKAVRVVHEIQMDRFGNVDLVIAELDEQNGVVTAFLPVELQAVDITGSYFPAYTALIESQHVAGKCTYGFNWANARKRFMTQLVTKGLFCNAWGTRIVAVVQDDLFDRLNKHSEIVETSLAQSNIVFMTYQFSRSDASQPWTLGVNRVVPTTHSLVQNAIMYEPPPSKAAFEQKLLARIST